MREAGGLAIYALASRCRKRSAKCSIVAGAGPDLRAASFQCWGHDLRRRVGASRAPDRPSAMHPTLADKGPLHAAGKRQRQFAVASGTMGEFTVAGEREARALVRGQFVHHPPVAALDQNIGDPRVDLGEAAGPGWHSRLDRASLSCCECVSTGSATPIAQRQSKRISRPVQRAAPQICCKCLRSIATKFSDRPKLLVCRRRRQSLN